jgi:hypothetical protein
MITYHCYKTCPVCGDTLRAYYERNFGGGR